MDSCGTYSGMAREDESVRMGLTYKQFAKYALMKLGVETDITRFVRKNVPRRIAPRAEVLARMQELGVKQLKLICKKRGTGNPQRNERLPGLAKRSLDTKSQCPLFYPLTLQVIGSRLANRGPTRPTDETQHRNYP